MAQATVKPSRELISTNPSRGYEVIGKVRSSTEQEVKDTVAKARAKQPAWAALSIAERCKAIGSFVELSRERAREIAESIACETGRPVSNCKINVARGIEHFEYYIASAEEALRPQTTFETDSEIHRVYREPRGVVAAICPWNYPYLNIAWQCGQALIAGNTIVYKNSEENPLFAKLVADLFMQSKVPDGIFNVIYGDGQVGNWLTHANIDMISFTGSTQTGHALTKIAAEKFIPIVTELGGSSPCIVFDDVEITDEMANAIFNGRFIHSGQLCNAIKRLIVHESKFEQLVDKLCAIAATRKLGDALDEDTELGPLVAQRQVDKLKEQVFDALNKGAKIRYGGKQPDGLNGAYHLPTIVTGITYDMRIWREEVFGPVLPVVSFVSENEAVQLANDTEYGLSAHVFTQDKRRFERVAHKIHSGVVAQNQVNYLNPRNPFGGYKHYGMGRVNGPFGFHEFTQLKLISEER